MFHYNNGPKPRCTNRSSRHVDQWFTACGLWGRDGPWTCKWLVLSLVTNDINVLNRFCFKSLLCHYAKLLVSQWPVVKRSCSPMIQIVELWWCHVHCHFMMTFIDEIKIGREINSITKETTKCWWICCSTTAEISKCKSYLYFTMVLSDWLKVFLHYSKYFFI